MEYFIADSIRLSRFLYSLGFDKESIFVEGKEKWRFVKTKRLEEALSFYFNFRKSN